MATNRSFSRAVKSVIRTKSFAPKKPKLPPQNRRSLVSCSNIRQVFRSELAPATRLCQICFRSSRITTTTTTRIIRKFEKVHPNCICRLLSNPRVKRKRSGRSQSMTIYQLLYCPCSKLELTNIKRSAAKKCQHNCIKRLAVFSERARGLQRRPLMSSRTTIIIYFNNQQT